MADNKTTEILIAGDRLEDIIRMVLENEEIHHPELAKELRDAADEWARLANDAQDQTIEQASGEQALSGGPPREMRDSGKNHQSIDYGILLCVHGGLQPRADRLAACVKAGLIEYVSVPQLTVAGKEALFEKWPEMRDAE